MAKLAVRRSKIITAKQKILDFIKVEPILTDDKYNAWIKTIAKELKISKDNVRDLVRLADTDSQAFEKALSQSQESAPDS